MVSVKGASLPISKKYSMDICRFIRGKPVAKAIEDLEQVSKLKKAVPMKGEIPHRKGKGMMAGRFPQKASKYFIMLLKSLASNANNHDLEEPVVSLAVANFAPKQYGRFGSVKRKRTHVLIQAINKKKVKKQKTKQNGRKKHS